MNQVILMGRLTRDPEIGSTQSGAVYAKFGLAVDKGLTAEKKRQAESAGHPTADFINIVLWQKMAETAQRFLHKGARIVISGRIQTGSYTAQDGTKRYTTDVVGVGMDIIDWPDRSAPAPSQTQPAPSQTQEDDYNPIDDTRIPF